MKRMGFVLGLIAALFLVFSGCSDLVGFQPNGPGTGWGDDTVPENHNIVMGVNISGSHSMRSVMPSDWAGTNANTYSLYLYNETMIVAAHLFASSGTLSMAVPQGTYNAVLLGGRRTNSTNSFGETHLFGSQKYENVVVGPGRTTLDFSLSTVSMVMAIPSEIAYGSTFTLEMAYRLGAAHGVIRGNSAHSESSAFATEIGSETTGPWPTAHQTVATPIVLPTLHPTYTHRAVRVVAPSQDLQGGALATTITYSMNPGSGIYLYDADMNRNGVIMNLNSVDWTPTWIHGNPGLRFNYPTEYGIRITTNIMPESEVGIDVFTWVNGN